MNEEIDKENLDKDTIKILKQMNKYRRNKTDKEKCLYCSGGEIELTSFESEEIEDDYIRLLFDPEDRTLSITDDMSRIIGSVDIEYCPFCSRKL